MADPDIDLPKVGKFPKKALIPIAAAAAAYIGWRYWQARSGTGDDAEDSTISDGEFGAVDSSIPTYTGSYSYGTSSDSSSSSEDNDTTLTTNAAWTTYARSQLQGSYDDADIVAALGNYLGTQPLSTAQQTIVRAAIAVAGYPPVGSFSIISGGNTTITVAPTNVHVQSTTETTAVIAFNAVSGASRYNLYRSGASTNVGSGTGSPLTMSGLAPGTSYTVYVAALNAAGSVGPRSAGATAKTKTYTLAKPSAPKVSSITKSSAKVTTGAVSHADGYRWYVNGTSHGYSESTSYTLTGLAAGKSYTVTVAADLAKQSPGPTSAGTKFTTKKS